jgi:hypothetical protein
MYGGLLLRPAVHCSKSGRQFIRPANCVNVKNGKFVNPILGSAMNVLESANRLAAEQSVDWRQWFYGFNPLPKN